MGTNIVKLGLIGCLMLFLVGCKTHKLTLNDQVSYEQALQCVEQAHFKIKIIEFYDKEDNTMKHPSDSYVYVNGKNAVIRFSKDLGMSFRGYAYIEDKSSQISDKKTNSKGDLLFVLKVDGGDTWLEYNLRVTLFKDTNKCFVQLIDRWANEKATFTGTLEPIEE